MIKQLSSFLSLVMLSQTPVFADIPRTPDGKPDLSGFFDTATLTPLQRSEELGDKSFITQEEAAKIAAAVAATRSKSSLPSDPNRGAPESGGDGTAGAGGGEEVSVLEAAGAGASFLAEGGGGGMSVVSEVHNGARREVLGCGFPRVPTGSVVGPRFHQT